MLLAFPTSLYETYEVGLLRTRVARLAEEIQHLDDELDAAGLWREPD
jgi:hypothetical protein